MLDLEKARKELREKTIRQIHEQTAWTWASRAVAMFEISTNIDGFDKVFRFSDAIEFVGEAKEHAAQVSAELVAEIEAALVDYSFGAAADIIKSTGAKDV